MSDVLFDQKNISSAHSILPLVVFDKVFKQVHAQVIVLDSVNFSPSRHWTPSFPSIAAFETSVIYLTHTMIFCLQDSTSVQRVAPATMHPASDT